jgi:hypothetical protein
MSVRSAGVASCTLGIVLVLVVGSMAASQEGKSASSAGESTDPVTAYFNLMDFACTQAWNRQVVTPAQDRQRVAFTLQQSKWAPRPRAR